MLLLAAVALAVPAAGLAATPAGAAVAPDLSVSTTYLTGLDHPWDIAFLPDGTLFVTERPGRLDVRVPGGALHTLEAPSDVLPGGEGGMLGLAVDPLFASNRWVYTCFSSTAGGTPDNRLVRWTVNADFTATVGRTDIVTGLPYSTGRHSGCRPRFGPDGAIWIGTGDTAVGTVPQSKTSLGGKVLRVDRNGNGVTPNPGVDDPSTGFDPRIYNYGHRNMQGLAFRPGTGAPFGVEHGTDRDDEVNRLVAGGNYGWDPNGAGGTYDESQPMTDFTKFPAAIGAVWSSGYPTIAPSGATFLSGSQWGDWNGALAVAVLKNTELRLMFLDSAGLTVTSQYTVPQLDLGVRLRSAVQGPDGNLYITTDDGAGAVWKVRPFTRGHRERRLRAATGSVS